MPNDNVEVVRRFVDCWRRLDWDGAARLLDPDVEQLGTAGGVEEGRVLRGAEEIRRDYETVEETWEEHRVEPQEIIDAGDRVVVLTREYQRGKASGVESEIDTAAVFELRDGRIVRLPGIHGPRRCARRGRVAAARRRRLATRGPGPGDDVADRSAGERERSVVAVEDEHRVGMHEQRVDLEGEQLDACVRVELALALARAQA